MRKPSLKKSLHLSAALVLALTVLFAAGCGQTVREPAATGTGIYYLDEDGMGTTRVAFEPEGGGAAEMASSYLTALKTAPAGSVLKPLLPETVALKSSRLDGALLTLDFSEAYLKIGRADEVLLRSGYVRTLIQVPGIDYVLFTVNGEPLMRDDGSAVGPMNADTFIENAGKSVNAYLQHDITLYFANENGSSLVAEGRSIYYNSNKPLEWAIVERLIAGPKAGNSYRTIAAETQIISVATQDRTCYVNLNEAFNISRPAVTDEVAIYSIVNSLCRNCDIDNVQIAIGGSTAVTYGEGTDLNRLFQMNKGLIAGKS